MPDEDLNRYFSALRADSDVPRLPAAASVRSIGSRRTRNGRIAGAGAAGLVLVAIAGTVLALQPTAHTPAVDPAARLSASATDAGPIIAVPPSTPPTPVTPPTTPPASPSTA